ncbi:MAG: peptidoglycan bridge formation glycyltransferase FemA/FemB family protein [Candidatus Limnocylindrales bacterium]|jgi:lipid II:glycine glycyltransferase (peptidoglycan interpeptide bridge formation enzyme)
MPEQDTTDAGDRDPAATRASFVDLAPDLPAWDGFVARSDPGSYLQTSAWAEVKAPNGWSPLRFMGAAIGGSGSGSVSGSGENPSISGDEVVTRGDDGEPNTRTQETAFGVQILVRKPRLFPWVFAYAPRGPVFERWNPLVLEAFTGALREAVASSPVRVSHVRIEPEIELNGPADLDGEFRHALRGSGWRVGAPIQPPRTRQIDLRADETALWGDLRKKWRQYVNKARKSDIRVVDATIDRLPEFYSIYRETAKRAGFVIRTYESYLGVWHAFARLGMARLLMAEGPDGVGLATLFLLRVGNRVIEPYGGMTEAGGECRANYLLKWEAIRTSRNAGATSYDMWGISHEGIEHFKTGFGGREIKYVGAWDLVLDPAGRLAYDGAQVMQDRIGAWRHGIRKVRGRPHPPGGESSE